MYDSRTEVNGLDKKCVCRSESADAIHTMIGNQEITVDMANWCLGRFKDAYEIEMQTFIDCVLEDKAVAGDAATV